MNAAEFVAAWIHEKNYYLGELRQPGMLASKQISDMGLSEAQSEKLHALLDTVITDIMVTLLFGLDGEGQLGGYQQTFQIFDEDGNLISKCGDIHAETSQFEQGRA